MTNTLESNPMRHTFRVRSVFLSSLRDAPDFLPEHRRDSIRWIVEAFQKEGVHATCESVDAGLIERHAPSREAESCEEITYSYTWRATA